MQKDYFGVYCGRFNPLHAGHEAVLNEMLAQFGVERSRVIIGSANTSQSLRHFFSYEERRSFIKEIFPDIRIMPLGDMGNDDEWMTALDDLLLSSGIAPEKVVFFGGCEEDINFFLDRNRKYHILNRFDGTTPKISATEIRDGLIHDRSLDGFINPQVEPMVRSLFKKKWEDFQKK